MKKIALLTAFFMVTAVNGLLAQDRTSLEEAFKTSYTNESNAEYAKAAEVLKKVYDESSYELNLRLGWLDYQAGLFTESIAFYNKSILLMPMSIEARLGFVLPAAALGNWNQVISRYNEILKIDPNHYTVNYRMGLIYYGRKDYQTAYKYFEKIANLYPFDYDALHMFGWTNYRLGKLREAKVLFGKALLNKPGDASAREGYDLIK
ncbi:MAG: tetratricopeptide repeat protein [Lentimicrobium sp.]|jgi:tetratricopeptide (TPR) repeat protein|nr:tetratricopeptide repeat protein [Lentimicrobium sp.]